VGKTKIGIDLIPIHFRRQAPGTARHVEEQARALFKMDLPWQWVPVIAPSKQKLYREISSLHPRILSVNKRSIYTTFQIGKTWRSTGCSMGFSTAYFVPAGNFPTVTNFFDGHILIDYKDVWHHRHHLFAYLLMNGMCRYSIQRSKKIFVDSKYYRDKLAALYPRFATKFIVIPCGIRLPIKCPTRSPAWLTLKNKRFFLYVGSVSDNKNQKTLLKAWSVLQNKWPDLPGLVLIGSYPEVYYNSVIIPLIRTMPRPDEVFMPGFVSENDLAWCYNKAQSYVQPSISEGFGLPIIEAMSYNLPVACSNTTSLPETAGYAALYFNPMNANEIANVLEKLWQDQGTRTELIRKGEVRWKTFTWENNAKLVAQHIDEVLSDLHSRNSELNTSFPI
jgi:glycosyltransferase involved in cell wall biosynthesis